MEKPESFCLFLLCMVLKKSGNGPTSPVEHTAIPPPVCISLTSVLILLTMRFPFCFCKLFLWVQNNRVDRQNVSGKTMQPLWEHIFLLRILRELEHIDDSRSIGKWFFTHSGEKECSFQSNRVLTPLQLKASALQIVDYIFSKSWLSFVLRASSIES